MFYEEQTKVVVLNCKQAYNSHTNRDYLKCKCKVKNGDSETSMSVHFYGDSNELEKIQESFSFALESGKSSITLCTDVNFVYSTSFMYGVFKQICYAVVEDFRFYKNKVEYEKGEKINIEQKKGKFKIKYLQQQIDKLNKKIENARDTKSAR